MSTTTAFPDCQQDDLLARMPSGTRGAIDFIQGFDESEQRRELDSLAQRTVGQRDWPGKNFDAYKCSIVPRNRYPQASRTSWRPEELSS